MTCNGLNNTCDVCSNGFYRKANGLACSPCTDLVPDCAVCTANDGAGTAITCTQCAFNTVKIGNTCVACSNHILNCVTCNTGNNTCNVCAVGFYRKSNGLLCSPCTDLVQSCSECNAIDDIGTGVNCSKCAANTYLSGNACITCA